MDARRLTFGPFELDAGRKLLFRQGTPVAMGQRGLALLGALLQAGGRTVSKTELMDVAWPSQQVEESNLSVQIAALRKRLGPRADGEEWIMTVPRVGYQFVDPGAGIQSGGKSVLRQAPEFADISPAGTATVLGPEKGKPLIAVLPFSNMSGDPEQEYFADGITEDIITDLSKVSGLSVIARQSVFTYKGRHADAQEVGRRFNASNIVEGSVRKAGSRIRINAQLIDSRDGTHLWADRYDRDLTDVFAIQDEITHTIIEQLRVRLLPKEQQAIETAPTRNLDAYNFYLQGRHFYHLLTTPHTLLAQRMFKRAIDLDPAYARAYAGLADCAWNLYITHHSDATVEEILEASTKALALDPLLAEAHASHGLALYHSGRIEEAIVEFERAIALNSNLFEAFYNYSQVLREIGDRETAAKMLARAAEIAPDDFRTPFGLAHMYEDLGRKLESREAVRIALERAERALSMRPDIPLPAALSACALARLGERDRAIEWANRALTIAPDEPYVLYNVSCCYSLLDEPDKAVELLERWSGRALSASKNWIAQDTDFDKLRDYPRFRQLLSRIELPS